MIWDRRVSDKRKSTLGIFPATFQLKAKEDYAEVRLREHQAYAGKTASSL